MAVCQRATVDVKFRHINVTNGTGAAQFFFSKLFTAKHFHIGQCLSSKSFVHFNQG